MVPPGTSVRQAREQRRHARHVAVVFAGLVGAAVDDVGALVAGISSGRCAEIQLLHKHAFVVVRNNPNLFCAAGYFRRTARTGQANFRLIVGAANHGGIQVGEFINLRCAQKAHIYPPALQPVAKNLRHRDHRLGVIGKLAVAY
jgi:hypothetical protein